MILKIKPARFVDYIKHSFGYEDEEIKMYFGETDDEIYKATLKCLCCRGRFFHHDWVNELYVIWETEDQKPQRSKTSKWTPKRISGAPLGPVCPSCLALPEPDMMLLLEQSHRELSAIDSLLGDSFYCVQQQTTKGLKETLDILYEEITEEIEPAYDFNVRNNQVSAIQKVGFDQVQPTRQQNEYIYLIGSPDGYCKIGRTKNLTPRLLSLGIQLPFKVELLHSIKVTDSIWAERYLHQKFADKRMNGEWFQLSPEEIKWICQLTSLEPQTAAKGAF